MSVQPAVAQPQVRERQQWLHFRKERYEDMPSIVVESIGKAYEKEAIQGLFNCMIKNSKAMMVLHNYDRDPYLLRPFEFMEDVKIVSVRLCFRSERELVTDLQRLQQIYQNAMPSNSSR